MTHLNGTDLEQTRLDNALRCFHYLQELVNFGGVLWRRAFLLSRLHHDGQPDFILAAIDDHAARVCAAGRDPLEGAFFDASTLPVTAQIALYDAMGAGDTETMNRILQLPAVQNSEPSRASPCWDKDAN